MPARDDDKRRAFAIAYATSGNATEAAKMAGVPDSSAHSMGYRWLRVHDVQLAIRMEQESLLRGMTGMAIGILSQLLNDQTAPSHIRLSAAREVLDRSGFAKPKRKELLDIPSVTRSPGDMSREELMALAGLYENSADHLTDD